MESHRQTGLPGPASLFDLKFLRDARISPDGRRVAYAVSATGSEERFEIWILDLSGAAIRVPFAGRATAPRWSADGRRLAFVGDARLRVATIDEWAISEPLTPAHLTMQGAPSWRPDGERIAVSLLEHHQTAGLRRIAGRHFRADGYGFTDSIRQRIHEIDPCAASIRCLTPSEGCCVEPQWSPCGRRVMFLANEAAFPFASYSPRLLAVEVESLEITEVLGAPWFIAQARWLPDGERIAVAAARASTLTVPVLSLWVVDRKGGGASERTTTEMGNVGWRTHHDMPARDLTHDNMLLVLDERTAFVTAQKGGSVEIWRVALDGDVSVDRMLTGPRSCIALDAHCTVPERHQRSRAQLPGPGGRQPGGFLAYAVSDPHSPPELWRCALDGTQEQRLTHLNDAVLEPWPKCRIEPFTFESADGLVIDAWFMASAPRGKPLPTVLFIHGGPFGSAGYAFCFDLHLLAARGYGIVFANFRGSAGYGESFVRAIMGDWGGRAYPDHVGAVDAAIARGLADPRRLGVWGASYGGFATCWIVGHTNRFKAAVAEAALTNFTTLYYLTDLPDVFRYDLGGLPHEMPESYRARSPITYAHRCTTPTLLVHGEEDLRCPISEAEQFHRALCDVGCVTELVRIPRCSHLGDSVGPLSARLAQNDALLDWFERYL